MQGPVGTSGAGAYLEVFQIGLRREHNEDLL